MTVFEYVQEQYPELLIAGGFNDALLGVATRCGQPTIAIYDRRRCIEILVAQGLAEDEAEEFFSFNTEGAWVGPETPAFLDRPPAEDLAASAV
jgi:hypothetical protein